MAREDVNIKVSANVAEAIRLWKAMQEGPEAMGRELDALGAKGRQSAGGMAGEFDKLIGKWSGIAAGIQLAKKMLDDFIASQKEALKRTEDATVFADQASRELFLLTSGKQNLATIRNQVLDTAISRGVAPEKAFDAAKAMLGAGFDENEVLKGGGLNMMLRILAANNASGKQVDAKMLTDAMTGFLSATGQDLTTKNLQDTGVAIQNLFAKTKLGIEDLPLMSSRAAAISKATGMQGNDILALFSQFRDITDPSTGATAFRGGVLKLAGAANSKARMRLLKQLGVSPEDVDFQGEDFFQVQKLLSEKFEAHPDRARLMSGIFGEESILFATTLLNKKAVEETARRRTMSGDTQGFAQAADVIEGGYEAKRAAAQAHEIKTHFEQGFVDPVAARQLLIAWMKQNDVNAVTRAAAEKTFDVGVEYGGDAGVAMYSAVRMAGGDRAAAKQLTEMATANDVNVKVTLQDQNAVAIPHKAEVHKVGDNKAGR